MIRRHGRVYVKGTAEGFQKMRDRGIPQPSLRKEDLMTRTIALEYQSMFEGLIGKVSELAPRGGYRIERREGKTIIVQDADPRLIMEQLIDLMGEPDVERLRLRLNVQLIEAQKKFLSDLMADADPRTIHMLSSMSIPARQVFSQRLEELRELYLDSAKERIQGEADFLKKAFLKKLVDWAEGKTPELHVTRLVDEMKETSMHRARFFARDQFSRFNKSLMIASYTNAEAQYVEILTCGDERVRPAHKEWNHKLFTLKGYVNDPRYNDYLCRCAPVPVYGPLTESQRRRLVA